MFRERVDRHPWMAAAGGSSLADRLQVDLGADSQVAVSWSSARSDQARAAAHQQLVWPLGADALEELRWYLEDYLRVPYGVWEERGPAVQQRLASWGEAIFASIFGERHARDAYQLARDQGAEVVIQSAEPELLALPWELMRDENSAVALATAGISRSLPTSFHEPLEVSAEALRVLMVISRPLGTGDIGYQMVARPLLGRLKAVSAKVDLTVLRPPTFSAFRQALIKAADDGTPFHVVHFDGHGIMPQLISSPGLITRRRVAGGETAEGALAFEQLGGANFVGASHVAAALAAGRVPVVVLNACQSGAIGKNLEASIATALLHSGCAAVVAMAYSIYAAAAAEFMTYFYESLLTGATVGQSVTVGRRRLFDHNNRPSPRGDMPLADWVIPVHYTRQDVTFLQPSTSPATSAPSVDPALDLRPASPEPIARQDPLNAAGTFVGRDDLLLRLESAARQHVVILTGPGGTGKTELAKAFAQWWQDTRGVDEPQMVFWRSFEPGTASLGLDAAITSLGLELFGSDFALLDGSQKLDAVEQALTDHRMLLIWDNFETVREMPDPSGATPPLDDEDCAALKGFLSRIQDHSASVVIITSRAQETWLGAAERIVVGGLTPPEAALYADYLLASSPTAQRQREHRSFGELLEWLDGHPLAMRLTLPRLDVIGPQELLAGLQGITPLLADNETAGSHRHSSLPACIAYSFAHLSEHTRRLLPAVSLFQSVAYYRLLSAFSTDVLPIPARFADADMAQWTEVLEDAARVGLLTSLGRGMYQIHPALPGYLASEWHACSPDTYLADRLACETALRAVCGRYGQWLAGEIRSAQAQTAFTNISLLEQTMGALLGSALEHQAWSDADGIVRALKLFWDARGLSAEPAAWADRIVTATTSPGQDMPAIATPAGELWLYILNEQANRQMAARQLDDAARTFRRVLSYLEKYPPTDDFAQESIASVYQNLGIVAQLRSRLGEAEAWYRGALAIRERLRSPGLIADTYYQLGTWAGVRGELDEADSWYLKALTLFEGTNDRPRIAGTLLQMASAAYLRGNNTDADGRARSALTIFEEHGDLFGIARSCLQLGANAESRGRLDDAEAWDRKGLTVLEELGDRPGIASAYQQLGTIAQARDRFDDAEQWHLKALTIFEQLDDTTGIPLSYYQLGMAAQGHNQLDDAEDWYRKALTIFEQTGDRPRVAMTYHQLGTLAYRRHEIGQAEDWYRRAITIDAEIGNFPAVANGFQQLGTIALDSRHYDVAEGFFNRALSINEKLDTNIGIASVYHLLGRVAQARGQLDEAERRYLQSLAINEELGNRAVLAETYTQLGLLAEDAGQLTKALEWNIRCLALFGQFPSPMTPGAPIALFRLTCHLGVPTVEQAWQQVTGRHLPQRVREYVTHGPSNQTPGDI
jgi:tetratricopeptide (TPR) repeat protein